MEFGGELGFLTGGSTITAPEPRTEHACLEELAKLLNKTQGKFPRALITSLGRASQCILSSLQFLVQFQGISSQQQVE